MYRIGCDIFLKTLTCDTRSSWIFKFILSLPMFSFPSVHLESSRPGSMACHRLDAEPSSSRPPLAKSSRSIPNRSMSSPREPARWAWWSAIGRSSPITCGRSLRRSVRSQSGTRCRTCPRSGMEPTSWRYRTTESRSLHSRRRLVFTVRPHLCSDQLSQNML